MLVLSPAVAPKTGQQLGFHRLLRKRNMGRLIREEDALPIVAFRGFARDISISNVPCDRRAITPLGWAVSSGSREPKAQHVTALNVACLLGMQPLGVAIRG